jgi:hypothetical protein
MKRFLGLPYLVGGAVALLCATVFLLADNGYANLSINHELDAINLLTLGVNIFIAFFLQYYFASRATDDRAEKNILRDNVRDVFNVLRSCRDEVMSCHGISKISKENQKKIIKLFRNLSNGLENLQTAIEMSGCKKLKKECEVVLEKFFKYKAATTGKFPYDASDISYQDQTYRAIMRELHALAFKINKHR